MTTPYRSYTRSERMRRTGLVLRGAKQALADCVDYGIERRIDRIDAEAEDRGAREATALIQQDEQARNHLASAKAAERVARGQDKAAARATRRQAEQQARRTAAALRQARLA